MCPEPEFGMRYRRLIQSYWLSPEAAAFQLERILARIQSGGQRALPALGKQTTTQTKDGETV